MEEKAFIYGRLKFLTEQTESLFELIERQQDSIEKLTQVIETMQTDEYARKQARLAKVSESAEKIAFIRKMSK